MGRILPQLACSHLSGGNRSIAALHDKKFDRDFGQSIFKLCKAYGGRLKTTPTTVAAP